MFRSLAFFGAEKSANSVFHEAPQRAPSLFVLKKGDDRKHAIEDKSMHHSRLLVHALYKNYVQKVGKRFHYFKLVLFLILVAWFLAMLCLQKEANLAYQIHSTVSYVLTPEQTTSQSPEDFYQWLKTTVQTVWEDPICGDGICKLPWEFASYSSFGCRADCGQLPKIQNLTKVQVDLYWNFTHPVYSVPLLILMKQAKWNLCPQRTSFSSKCYFGNLGDQSFERPSGTFHLDIDDIPDGEWSLQVLRDSFLKISGAVRKREELRHAAYYYKVFMAMETVYAENSVEVTLMKLASEVARTPVLRRVKEVHVLRGSSEADAEFLTQELINASCFCDTVPKLGNESFTWGNEVYSYLHGTVDYFQPSRLESISSLAQYKSKYCSPLGAASPVLYELVAANQTTNGTLVFGPVPVNFTAENYTQVNVTQLVTNVSGKCHSSIMSLLARQASMFIVTRQTMVDTWVQVQGRSLRGRTASFQATIKANLPELDEPVFSEPLESRPVHSPYNTTLDELQKLYRSGLTFRTQPGPAAMNMSQARVYMRNLTLLDLAGMAEARIAEIYFQEGEANATVIPHPPGTQVYPDLTMLEIVALFRGAGASDTSLPHPSNSSLGVLATNYNLVEFKGNNSSYKKCSLDRRAPEYVGSCVPMQVNCTRSSNDTAPFDCRHLASGESITGSLRDWEYRRECEQPCDTQLDCAAMCECYGMCGSQEVCLCDACAAMGLDAAADNEFASIIYAALESGYSSNDIATVPVESAGSRKSFMRRQLMAMSQEEIYDELKNAADALEETRFGQDDMAEDLSDIDASVSQFYRDSLTAARDDNMAELITKSQEDWRLTQASVLERLDEVIGLQDAELQLAQEVVDAVALVESSEQKFAAASGELRNSIQDMVVAIGVTVQQGISTLGQALALWKKVRRDRAVSEKEVKLANSPCLISPITHYVFVLNGTGTDAIRVPRERNVGTNNRVIGGMLIHQVRKSPHFCNGSKFSSLATGCQGESSTQPYGVDPIFSPQEALYSPALFDVNSSSMTSIYNCSTLPQASYGRMLRNQSVNNVPFCKEMYNPSHLPYAFHHFPLKGKADGFPVLLDINLGEEEAAGMVEYLKQAKYMDRMTKTISADMVMYNAQLRMFSYFYLQTDLTDGGSVKFQHYLQQVRLDMYLDGDDAARFVLESMLTGMVVIMLLYSLAEMTSSIIVNKSLEKWLTAKNVYTLFCDLLMVAAMILWWCTYKLYADTYDVMLHYDVYNQLGPRPNALELADSGRGLTELWEAFSSLREVITLLQWYFAIQAINIMLLIGRLHIYIAFQAQLGLVPRTLVKAGSDLAHFVIVYLVVFMLMATLGFLCFGSTIKEFSTLPNSINVCFEFLLGNIDVNAKLRELKGVMLWMGGIFFWVFNWLVFLVMINFLLAIICDAFDQVSHSDDSQRESLFAEVSDIMRHHWLSIKRYFSANKSMSERELMEYLAALAREESDAPVPLNLSQADKGEVQRSDSSREKSIRGGGSDSRMKPSLSRSRGNRIAPSPEASFPSLGPLAESTEEIMQHDEQGDFMIGQILDKDEQVIIFPELRGLELNRARLVSVLKDSCIMVAEAAQETEAKETKKAEAKETKKADVSETKKQEGGNDKFAFTAASFKGLKTMASTKAASCKKKAPTDSAEEVASVEKVADRLIARYAEESQKNDRQDLIDEMKGTEELMLHELKASDRRLNEALEKDIQFLAHALLSLSTSMQELDSSQRLVVRGSSLVSDMRRQLEKAGFGSNSQLRMSLGGKELQPMGSVPFSTLRGASPLSSSGSLTQDGSVSLPNTTPNITPTHTMALPMIRD